MLGTLSSLIFVVLLSVLLITVTKRSNVHYQSFGHFFKRRFDLFERERLHTSRGKGAERKGEADSPLNMEPDMGLVPGTLGL